MNILSLFFNNDRVYTALISRGEKSLEVKYLNATVNILDPEDINSDDSQDALVEIKSIIDDVQNDYDILTATVPASSVLMTQFPGDASISEIELKKLLEFEIKNTFPKFDYQNFSSSVIPLDNRKQKKNMMIASIVPNEIHTAMAEISKIAGKKMQVIDISQFNAQSSFFYNYPDKKEEYTALVNIQGQFIDVSVLNNNNMVYYNLLSINDNHEIIDKWKEELNRITSDAVEHIDTVCLMGNGLSSDLMENMRTVNNFYKINTARFNTFRMMKADISEAEKDLAIRAMHIFPPCVGGAIPPYYKMFRLK